MFWQSIEDKQALSDWRAWMQKDRQLRNELIELQQTALITEDPRHRAWVGHMIKSIEHELHELHA